MKLFISEPEPRSSGPILVCDDDMNDIAEFFHDEQATVTTSYETALALARALVKAEEYRAALIDIAGSHTPDQPADSAADEVSWVMRHVGTLRRMAANALEKRE
jgi:hypothetical protein